MIKISTLTRFRWDRRISLAFGLLLGAFAAVLTIVYLRGAGTDDSAPLSAPTIPVVVAAQDISAGARITADMVVIDDVLDKNALTGSFRTTAPVVGQVAVVPLVAGEQLVPDKITATGGAAFGEYGDNPPLSLLLEPGERAVSVQFSSLVGAGGLVRPGDRVDIILSVKTESPAGKDQIAATVLQGLKVLAIDQDVAAQASAAEGTIPGDKDSNPLATTVTLAVSPVQGEVLALADMCRENFAGRLAIALRGFGDEGRTTRAEWPADGAPPNCTALLGIAGLP